MKAISPKTAPDTTLELGDVSTIVIGLGFLFGLPLLHVSFKYRPNRMPVVAKGVIAIGQFACGGFTLSQFGVGLVSISQFTLAGFALAQFAVAYRLIAQIGLYIHEGAAQFVIHLSDLLKLL